MIGLKRVTGPDCPQCGCPAQLVRAGEFAGRPWSVFGCDFCSHTFTIGRAPPADNSKVINGVRYQTVRCVCPNPACAAKNPPVVNTSGKYRWHKCDACGQTFKSVADQ